jgi:hypothetical protein
MRKAANYLGIIRVCIVEKGRLRYGCLHGLHRSLRTAGKFSLRFVIGRHVTKVKHCENLPHSGTMDLCYLTYVDGIIS